MKTITRNTVKGIIFEEDSVLLIKKEYEDGSSSYTLPGGGQSPGETLEETLKREVYEETAAHVKMIGLVKVYEHQKVSGKDPLLIRHKVEFAFHCRIIGTYTPTLGTQPDPHQTAVVWMPKNALPGLNLSPPALKNILLEDLQAETSNYLGWVI